MGILLKNFKGIRKAFEAIGQNTSVVDISSLDIYNVSGTKIPTYYGYKNTYLPMTYFNVSVLTSPNNASSNSTMISFGSGTTPVTENDYKLESIITSGIVYKSANSVTPTITTNDDSAVSNAKTVYSYCNTSGGTLTIGEIGFFQSFYYATSSTHPVLVHREVLSEPITLEAGEYFTLEVNIDGTISLS